MTTEINKDGPRGPSLLHSLREEIMVSPMFFWEVPFSYNEWDMSGIHVPNSESRRHAKFLQSRRRALSGPLVRLV